MTFDEAKLVVTAHGQEVFENLFRPCACGLRQRIASIREAGKPYEGTFSSPELCGPCKARLLVSAAFAVSLTEELPADSNFVSLVEQFYPS